MAQSFLVGTSGWNYPHWRGRFYPETLPQKQWFSHYCQTFDTVEINNTFYRQPGLSVFDRWRDQAPSGFLYAIKANRYLTHLRKLKDLGESLEYCLEGCRRLKNHLGPILYQLPPHWKRNLSRLREFAELLPRDLTHVLEFRDRSWLVDETYDLMAERNLSLCIHDLLPRHPRRVTGRAVYVRFHGTSKGYSGKYRPSRLRKWAAWLANLPPEHDIYIYFNNDVNSYAPRDAQALQEILANRGQRNQPLKTAR